MGTIVDFDEVLLDACPPHARADLMAEAQMLASVFAPGRPPSALEQLASQLSGGHRDGEMSRSHAYRLAAALRRIARASDTDH
ncbi:MAG: hypothetical protein JNK30_03105 [Phenylobacterium sp.]|uniref:hypothetical protein n=1 Tax=Phenylobacterium sp. TaxID=1871053 RepID=UPI001A3BDF4D|nr:hypothetical protein [Phenylobacterium sp.]MBL8770344.1 hypothetical protein [Phenylobacterium sp.]